MWTGPPGARRGTPRGRPVGQRHRDQDLARDRGRSGVELLEEAAEDLLVGRVLGGIQQEHVASDGLAVADGEQLDRGLVVLAGEADEVQLGPPEGRHLLALHRPLDRPDLVPEHGRLLVLLAFGRAIGISAVSAFGDGLLSTFEEQLDLVDLGPVVGFRDGLDAGPLATLDVKEEARPRQCPLALR